MWSQDLSGGVESTGVGTCLDWCWNAPGAGVGMLPGQVLECRVGFREGIEMV